MCEPTTMTVMALTAAAGATQAYSQIQQGRATEASANFNAREMENQATRIRNKGVEEENIQRRSTAEFLARQRAMLGASGIDIQSGSAADLQQDTEVLGEVDALRVRRNFSEQADVAERQALQTRAEGKAAKRAANVSALGTVLTTAASVGMMGAKPPPGTVSPKWYTPNSAAMSPVSTMMPPPMF